MRGAGRKVRLAVVLAPLPNEGRLSLIAQHHEWRSAGRIDDVDANFGQLGDLASVAFKRNLELVLRAALNLGEQRNNAHSVRQHLDQLFHAAGTISGAHKACRAAP